MLTQPPSRTRPPRSLTSSPMRVNKRVLPTPASPLTRTWRVSPASAAAKAARTCSTASARPTSSALIIRRVMGLDDTGPRGTGPWVTTLRSELQSVSTSDGGSTEDPGKAEAIAEAGQHQRPARRTSLMTAVSGQAAAVGLSAQSVGSILRELGHLEVVHRSLPVGRGLGGAAFERNDGSKGGVRTSAEPSIRELRVPLFRVAQHVEGSPALAFIRLAGPDVSVSSVVRGEE